MLLTNIINALLLITGSLVGSGILLHDMKLDKAAVTAVNSHIVQIDHTAKAIDSGNPHTHVERTSLAQALRDIRSNTPRIQPRSDDKQHALSHSAKRGGHYFGGFYLPDLT